MNGSELFPTLFSGKIAEQFGLLDEKPKPNPNERVESNYYDQLENLKNFQNMVLGGLKVQEALIAYHGTELSEEQITALTLIAKSTRPFVIGKLAGILMNKVEKGDGKAVVDAADILLTEMIKSGEGGMTQHRARELIVKLK